MNLQWIAPGSSVILKDGTELSRLHRAVGMVWQDGQYQPINNCRGYLFWGIKNGKWELLCLSNLIEDMKEYRPVAEPTPWIGPEL